jgi:hypothetical protein
MDMSISKKKLVNQLEPFKKPCFVIVGADFIIICGMLGHLSQCLKKIVTL